MSNLIQWIKKEYLHLLPVVIYFLISFNLVHFSQTLVHPNGQGHLTSYMGATIAAFLAGKIILIADSLPFISAFPRKPIIWNITWKFFIYGIVVVLVQVADHFFKGWYYTGSSAYAMEFITNTLSHSVFWGIQIDIMTFFLIYIVFSEWANAIGTHRTRKIFFG